MTNFKKHIQKLEALIDNLRYNRYKVLLLVGKPLSGKTKLAKELTAELDGTYIDTLERILPNIKSPTLGAYGPMDFKKEIISLSQKANYLLTIDEIEPVLTTFPKGKQDVVDFFTLLQYVEVKAPIMIVTRFVNLIKQSNFPPERIYCL